MKLGKTIRSLAIAALFCAGAWAQDEASSDANGTLPPSPFGEKRGKKTMFGEAIGGHWTLGGSVTSSAMWNSQARPASAIAGAGEDYIQQFGARVTASIFGKRLRYEAHYMPEYAYYHEFDSQNAMSHSFTQDLAWRMTERVDMVWTLDARKFASNQLIGGFYAGAAGVPLVGSNLQAAEQNQDVINSNTSVLLTYTRTSADRYTLRLSSGMSHFSGTNVGGSTAELQFSHSATVGWSHTFDSGRRTLGVEATQSYFGFIRPNRHQQNQNAKVRYSQRLPWKLQASIGVGPSFSHNQPQLSTPADFQIGWALDASLDREFERWAVGLSYNHGEQLSLIQQSITSDQITARVTRAFGRQKRWTATANAGFTRAQRQVAAGYLDGGTGGFVLTYRINRNLNFNANYTYLHQHDEWTINPFNKVNRHQASGGFTYTFGPFQPGLGR